MGFVLLIAGLLLWSGAHLFKRLAPEARARLGEPGKGLVTVLLVLSIVMMVYGYRWADGPWFWGRSAPLVGINNLLMVVAFYVYAASAAKSAKIWLGTKVRHPQLTAVLIFVAAHLLVNGDLKSFVLFGGLALWAIAEIIIINRQEGPWTPPPRAKPIKEITTPVIAMVAMTVVMLIHNWLGVQPWGA
ncbi:membrane protein [Jannaschia pagri]|uniref:Membrane protein n=1 Tax=Jannaschia pagri TaxID=2829797 RepID=A0ABQ4NL33_9RHOB|nr:MULTISPECIES: NnrU family protein [unclassified Jannaschia]GIT91292.1 membrane protein [Jannaschia sp. AI_61]GIT95125.1 membrane protein [Jannaschia sp. AI_62]